MRLHFGQTARRLTPLRFLISFIFFTPFKALAFEDGVNYTAGLPVVRTSPDHGTAYEMAGRDLADPRSMKAAIYAAIDIYNNRVRYDELIAGRMTIKLPDTEIKPKGGRIIE